MANPLTQSGEKALPAELGESLGVNQNSGSISCRIPVPLPEGRSGFTPALNLVYGSPVNGPFGIGWSLPVGMISRSARDHFPTYQDHRHDDPFVLSGIGELLPEPGEDKPDRQSTDYRVKRYFARHESAFIRIEKWTEKSSGQVHWRTLNGEGVTSIYGISEQGRLADPEEPDRVYQWLLERQFDDRGNVQRFEYKPEDTTGVDNTRASEANRLQTGHFTNRYLKRVLYSNSLPADPDSGELPQDHEWHFRIVFDYGEHDPDLPTDKEPDDWSVRPDPFSTYSAGFEIRYYRRCRRILVFHKMEELGQEPVITDALNLEYSQESPEGDSFLSSVTRRGYRQSKNGELDYKEIPPLDLSYTIPEVDNEVRELESVIDVSEQPVDLYGEGVNGLLRRSGDNWYYRQNLGDGHYGRERPVEDKPADASEFAPYDLDRDGQQELARESDTRGGYHELNKEKNGWKRFRPYHRQAQTGQSNGHQARMDLSGNGMGDLSVSEQGSITWYESEGRQGYRHPKSVTMPEDRSEGPAMIGSDLSTGHFVANLSGNGQDIVCVGNGHISYWPHLGYGRYGHRVTMDHVPMLDYSDNWDPQRILFSDINGTGRDDLLYVGQEGVRYWLNYSGNGLGKARHLEGSPPVHDHMNVEITDLLGSGTPCLTWVSGLPGDSQRQRYYIRLRGVQPSWRLSRMSNNMGKEVRIEYESSASLFLEDREIGKPWKSWLNRHPYVVRRVERIDHVTGSRHFSRYRYRDGYYDEENRRFGGFARVEKYDTERFEEFSGLASEDYVTPTCTVSWYHDGSLDRHGVQLEDAYRSDEQAPPESSIENEADLDAQTVREACRMLAGRQIREEIYATDEGRITGHPYRVTESAWRVRCLEPSDEERLGRFLGYRSDVRVWEYEQDATDPRVSQHSVLQVDDYGYPVRNCELYFPRAEELAEIPEQASLHAKLTDMEYVHLTDHFYRHGIEKGQTTIELHGLELDESGLITREELIFQITTALQEPLEYGDSLDDSSQTPQSRHLALSRTYYVSELGEATRQAAELAVPIRVHHSEQAVFDNTLVEQVYGDRVDDEMLEEAGYRYETPYWWQPTEQLVWLGGDGFYQLHKKTDALGGTETLTYDNYHLSVVETDNALGNSTVITPDYVALKPARIKDPNDVITERCYDSLNQLVAVTQYGDSIDREGELRTEGNLPLDEFDQPMDRPSESGDILKTGDVLDDPDSFLQELGEYHWSDLFAWKRDLEAGLSPDDASPVSKGVLLRESPVRSLESGGQDRILTMVQYRDGFGRPVQTKQVAGGGSAWVQGENGDVDEKQIDRRWLTSGGVVYNNKGDVVREYDPLFTGSHEFEPGETFLKHGTAPVYYYDPLGRHVKTDTPKGFFRRVEMTPWEVIAYDENDTVTESFYYETKIETDIADEAETEAVEKAEVHAGTPDIHLLDTMGRAVVGQRRLESGEELDTRLSYDMAGNRVSVVDPRQSVLNRDRSDDEQVASERTRYDMTGQVIYTNTNDSGERCNLYNVLGLPVHVWSARGDHTINRYDADGRPVSVEVLESGSSGTPRLVETMSYGEEMPGVEARNRNALGRLIEQRDAAGVIDYGRYDIQGRYLEKSRTLRADYKTEADWNEAQTLEEEVFQTGYAFDSLSRLSEKRLADGTNQRLEYQLHGPLDGVYVTSEDGELDERIIASTRYNALEQKTKTELGNGVEISLAYEDSTHRLAGLSSRRPEDDGDDSQGWKTLQQIDYTYDPVGNITRRDDRTREYLLANLPSSHNEKSRYSEFTYDSIYRLTEATGWTHKAHKQRDFAADGTPPDAFRGTRHLTMNNGQELTPYTRRYSYDPAGNIKQIRQTGEVSWTRKMWISDRSNRSLPARDWSESDRSETEGLFDSAGNLLKLDHLEGELSWNHRNELVGAVIVKRDDDEADDAEYYIYGSDFDRVRKVEERLVNGHVRRREKIYLDGCEIRREFRGDEIILERSTSTIRDNDRAVALIHHWRIDEDGRETEEPGSRKIHYQLDDGFGSSALEVDETGRVISYEEYSPYGESTFVAGDNVGEVSLREYRYAGKERDDVTGLYYYGFRYYAPWMGRWLKPDPAGSVDGWNLYAYLTGNPVGRSDVAGLSADDDMDEDEQRMRRELSGHVVEFDDLDEATQSELRERWESASELGIPLITHYPGGDGPSAGQIIMGLENIYDHVKQHTDQGGEVNLIPTDPSLREADEPELSEEELQGLMIVNEVEKALDDLSEQLLQQDEGAIDDEKLMEQMSEMEPDDMRSTRGSRGTMELRGIDRSGGEGQEAETDSEQTSESNDSTDGGDAEEKRDEPRDSTADDMGAGGEGSRGEGQGREPGDGEAPEGDRRRDDGQEQRLDPDLDPGFGQDSDQEEDKSSEESGDNETNSTFGWNTWNTDWTRFEERLDDIDNIAKERRLDVEWAQDDVEAAKRYRNWWLRTSWESGRWDPGHGIYGDAISEANEELQQYQNEVNKLEKEARKAERRAAVNRWLRRAGHVGTAITVGDIFKKSWEAGQEDGVGAFFKTLGKELALEAIGVVGGVLAAAAALALLGSAPLWATIAVGLVASVAGYWMFRSAAEFLVEEANKPRQESPPPPRSEHPLLLSY